MGLAASAPAQRRAKRACELGFWRMTRKAQQLASLPEMRDGAQAVEMRELSAPWKQSRSARVSAKPFTYEIDIEKFRSAPQPREIRHFDARSYAEYKAAAKRGEHPNVTEMPSRKPATSSDRAAHQPAAPPHQSQSARNLRPLPAARARRPLPITRDVRLAIAGCYGHARRQRQRR